MRRVEAPIEVAFRTGQKWPYLGHRGRQALGDVGKGIEVVAGGSERRVYYCVVADPGKASSIICVSCQAKSSDLREWTLRKIED